MTEHSWQPDESSTDSPSGLGNAPISSKTMNYNDLTGDDFIVTIDLDDPNEPFAEYWSRIYVADHIKQKLVNYSELERVLASRLDRMTFHRHGAVLLAGPPGTGKTSLAKGAANEIAARRDQRTLFQRIRIQKLFSSGFGDSPELVDEAFTEIIEIAQYGDVYQVVLLDEVESLFSSRALLAGDTDPMDAVRAVNRALERLDDLAEYPNVFVIATSNQPDIVDSAFADRTDDQLYVDMPDDEQRAAIFIDVFSRLNETFGTKLPTDASDLNQLVLLSEGFSGRRIRKLVHSALASSDKTATDPGRLDYAQVCEEFERKRTAWFDDEQELDGETGDVNEIEDSEDNEETQLQTDDDASEEAESRSTADASDRGHDEPQPGVQLADLAGGERDRDRREDGDESRDSSDSSRSDDAADSAAEPDSPAPDRRADRADQGADRGSDGDTPDDWPEHSSWMDDEGSDDPGSDQQATQDDENDPQDGASERSPVRFSRRVVFDPTVRTPHLVLRDEVREFLDETLAIAGYDGDGVDGLLDTADAEEFLYELCMGHRLDRIQVTVGNLGVDIEVIRDHTGRSSLRAPNTEAVPTIPTDAPIQYTFVLADEDGRIEGTLPDIPATEIEVVTASSA